MSYTIGAFIFGMLCFYIVKGFTGNEFYALIGGIAGVLTPVVLLLREIKDSIDEMNERNQFDLEERLMEDQQERNRS